MTSPGGAELLLPLEKDELPVVPRACPGSLLHAVATAGLIRACLPASLQRSERLLSPALKPAALLRCPDWLRRINKHGGIMIIGWSTPAPAQHRRHAQLIKCFTQTSCNERDNEL